MATNTILDRNGELNLVFKLSKNKGKKSNNKFKRNKYRKKRSITNWNKNKIHFIPKRVKLYIDAIFKKGLESREFMKEVKKEVNPSSNIWSSTLVYIIHESACRDKLPLIELILDRISNRKKLVNSKCGPQEFTPIFQSAYKGSIRALKMLLCAGADQHIINKMGETVMEALEQGNIDTNRKNPEYKVFTDERYSECRTFLTEWGSHKKEKVIDKDFKAYKPPKKRLDVKSDIVSGKYNEDITEMSILEFLNAYSSVEDIKKFISSQKSPVDSLVDIIIKASEKNNETFNKLISYLNKIERNIIENMLRNNVLIDYVKFDAPYTKKKMNILCKKYSISLIE